MNIIVEVFAFSISLIIIILFFFLYDWIQKLESEGCDCSDMWQRPFLRNSLIIILVVYFLMLFFKLGKNFFRSNIDLDGLRIERTLDFNQKKITFAMKLLWAVFIFAFLIIMFDFTKELREKQCLCSEAWIREFGYYYSLITIILFVLSFMVGIYMMISRYH